MNRPLRATAWAYGIVCHTLFVAAIAAMIASLYVGMEGGLGRLHGCRALLANLALVLQFPIAHSFLLTPRGRRVLSQMAPREIAQDLSTTTYAIIASLQLLAVFLFWSPSGVTLWEAHGGLRLVFDVAYAMSWLFVARAIYDAGMALQTGALGWRAVVMGEKPRYPDFKPHGTFKFSRQPVYLAFALTLWTGPVLSLEKLLLAVLWTLYCVVGPLFKEARYVRIFGDLYRAYQDRVPYWLPSLHKR
jgi:protein-S-isoprenylcysteine O-methyltransferase Ste14